MAYEFGAGDCAGHTDTCHAHRRGVTHEMNLQHGRSRTVEHHTSRGRHLIVRTIGSRHQRVVSCTVRLATTAVLALPSLA